MNVHIAEKIHPTNILKPEFLLIGIIVVRIVDDFIFRRYESTR